jgi:hypothetical protein
LLPIVACLGLNTKEFAPRRQRPRRQCAAGQQATAAHANQEGVEGTHLFEQFFGRCALPGNDLGVIVGRDKHQAALQCHLLRQLFAVLRIAVIEHDFTRCAIEVAPSGIDFGLRGVFGHQHHSPHTQQTCGQRHGLPMIARRESDHARSALRRAHGRQRIEGAPKLERTYALQVFALEEQLRTE